VNLGFIGGFLKDEFRNSFRNKNKKGFIDGIGIAFRLMSAIRLLFREFAGFFSVRFFSVLPGKMVGECKKNGPKVI